jgi:glutamate synthase domain-containing protein 3
MIEREHIEATQGERIRREYHERADAERAVERLHQAGFADDQVTITTHGATTQPDGTFVRGGIEIVVLCGDRADDAERILSAD